MTGGGGGADEERVIICIIVFAVSGHDGGSDEAASHAGAGNAALPGQLARLPTLPLLHRHV